MPEKKEAAICEKKISQVIAEALKDFKNDPVHEPLFVFSSEIEKNSWIDWAVKNKEESGVEAVNTEQFIAWDQFKTGYITPADKTKTCIPSLIRKIFAQKLLRESSFKKIILKSELNEDSIFTFTDWLAKILPSLSLWKKHYDIDFKKNMEDGNAEDDDENSDLLDLYNAYFSLLEKHGFYEPGYADINFSSGQRKIYIFYPSVFQDFSEYYETLSSSQDVTFVVLPESYSEKKNTCIKYQDARKELRRMCLSIRKLIESKKDLDLRRIAVDVPDLEYIRPYIERELYLYQIPYVVRNGLPYTKNCGGDIFIKIKDCIDTNFSLEAVRNLLMDGFIPWKNPELNLKLIKAGVELRIVGSTEKDNDLWIESLEKSENYTEEKEHFMRLKKIIMDFSNAESFRDLKNAWLEFSSGPLKKDEDNGKLIRDNNLAFVDEEKYEMEEYRLTDKILGRIISELQEFAQIEEDYNKEYPEEKLALDNYMDFFVNELKQSSYTPNDKKYGINIFSYRVAASADFDYHFILNASQNDITVPLKTLSFIVDENKRKNLGLNHENLKTKERIKILEDGSSEFIALYSAQQRAAIKETVWSSAKVNFKGASITHTALSEFDEEKISKDIEKSGEASEKDLLKLCRKYGGKENFQKIKNRMEELKKLDELDFVRNPTSTSFAQWQLDGFKNWRKINSSGISSTEISSEMKKKIEETAIDSKTGAVKISGSGLNSFFPCPKKWIYEHVINLEEERITANIAETNEIGNLYHKTLELYIGSFKGKKLPCLTEKDRAETASLVHDYLAKAMISDERNDMFKSILSSKVIEYQKPVIEKTLTDFILQFCSTGEFGGYTVEETEMNITSLEKNNEDKNDKGILYKGKIDCVLSCGTETNTIDGKEIKTVNAYIIDYKTGYVPTASDCTINNSNVIKNFQLATYVKLIESIKKKDGSPYYNVKQGLFYSLKKDGGTFKKNIVIDLKNGTGNSRIVSRNDFNLTMIGFNNYAEFFKSKINSLNFSTSSNYGDMNYVSPITECSKCNFKACCRTTFNIGKRD